MCKLKLEILMSYFLEYVRVDGFALLILLSRGSHFTLKTLPDSLFPPLLLSQVARTPPEYRDSAFFNWLPI